MFFAKEINIEFDYNGRLIRRKIDKITFYYSTDPYTLYRIKGKEHNYDLLKCGIWWQVHGIDRLPEKLLNALGKAIDKAEQQ
jgi:hypothetical protein